MSTSADEPISELELSTLEKLFRGERTWANAQASPEHVVTALQYVSRLVAEIRRLRADNLKTMHAGATDANEMFRQKERAERAEADAIRLHAALETARKHINFDCPYCGYMVSRDEGFHTGCGLYDIVTTALAKWPAAESEGRTNG